ncbi:hypothetical protein BDK51DRAFT_32496 [Blyttiomyces helicus]|uniref:Nucleoporin p58/p45 n=1 Tax=Blyttiomyces helicus TaxID=388810 RepID=A0A4P9VZL8_9FUNG|nr:hypothetical protein BDK51DRAFT_32496 [Blyttiomyces helicus]|eukprot:RKO85224.1 hypothetical protein BDK51DRAFT_32496 [Blyttiomyces helicus]
MSFGTSPTATSGAPAFGSTSAAPGLFGAPAASAPSATGLFGAPATSAPGPTGGLFGAPAGGFGAPPTSSAAPSMFGAPATSSAAPSLFGATATSSAAPSMFGATNAPAGGGFGGFGAAPAPTLSTAPLGASAGAPAAALSWKTKYSEAPEGLRQKLDQIQKYIQSEISLSETISTSSTVADINRVTSEMGQLSQKLAGMNNLIERDRNFVESLKNEVSLELRNADLATRFIERFKNSTSATQYSSPNYDPYGTPPAPSSYFHNLANQLEKKMALYAQSIEELETNLKNTISNTHKYTPQAANTSSQLLVLLEILRNQDDTFLSVAGKIAMVHDAIERHRHAYKAFRKKYLGEEDPNVFGDSDGGSKNGRDEMMSYSAIAETTLQPTFQVPGTPGGAQPAAGQSLFGGNTTGSSLFGQTMFGQSGAASPFGMGSPATKKKAKPSAISTATR